MTSPGTFENVIRIGQNPRIILEGDELITVRCFYGPPDVVTNPTPTIPTTLPTTPYVIALERKQTGTFFSWRPPSRLPTSPSVNQNVKSASGDSSYIYLVQL